MEELEEKNIEEVVKEETIEEPSIVQRSLDTSLSQTKSKKQKFLDAFLGRWRYYTKTQIIAINALLCAIVILFVIAPINFGTLDVAVIPIIAVLISVEVMGLLNGMLTGLFFGLCSLINQLIRPGIFALFIIQNPLVTFFPRIMIAVMAFLVMKLFDLIFSKIKYKTDTAKKITPKILDTIKYAIASAIGVITNTSGFLGFIYLFYFGSNLSNGKVIDGTYIWAIVASNALVEILVCTLVTPAIVLAVSKTLEITMRKKTKA